MEKPRRILSLVMSLLMIFSIVPILNITASAAVSGNCGNMLNWSYDVSSETLTISGIGAMENYVYSNAPWENYKDNIKNVVIADKVTTIGDFAFYYCQNLQNIEIGSGVNKIGKQAFAYCSSLKSITLPDGITTIADYLFSFCDSLTNIAIPDSVTSIGKHAFYNCKSLGNIIIPDSVTTIGTFAFYNCESFTSVIIPDSVTSIGERAFSLCKNLKNVTIGDGVTSIEAYTFSDCDNLESVTIGNGVTSIGDRAFIWCDNLTDVYYSGTEEQWNNVSVGVYNTALTNAKIHFLGNEHVCSFGEWIVENEPNCINTGIEKRECSCGKYETRIIQPNGIHQYSARKGEDPTCTEDGFVEYCCDICENSRYTDIISAEGHRFVNGKCEKCSENDPSVSEGSEYNYAFTVLTPSKTEIRNKDGIILHSNIEGDAPVGSYVKWESSNGNFDEDADGNNLEIIAKNKGWTKFTAILCDADGNELARDSVEMYSKSGFFDKIGGFFRSIFGASKIYEY